MLIQAARLIIGMSAWTSRKITSLPAASLSCSSSSSCSIAFLAGQNEHDDDHEHDQE
jgi:hypothetical protein